MLAEMLYASELIHIMDIYGVSHTCCSCLFMNKGCPRKPIIFIPELYATASKIVNIRYPIISCLLAPSKACCNVDTKQPHPDHSQASALLCLKSAQTGSSGYAGWLAAIHLAFS